MRFEEGLGEIAVLKLVHSFRPLPSNASPLHHLLSTQTGESKASKDEGHGWIGKREKKRKEKKEGHPIKEFRNADNGEGATRQAAQASETLVV